MKGLVAQLCPTLVTPWTVAHQVPLSMEFSMQEYWSGMPFPSPGDLHKSGIEPKSPVLQADSLLFEPPYLCRLYLLIFIMLKTKAETTLKYSCINSFSKTN